MVDVKEIKEWVKEETFDIKIICRASHKYYLPRVIASGVAVILFTVALALRLYFDTADALFNSGINAILGTVYGLVFFYFFLNMLQYVSFFCWLWRGIKSGKIEKLSSDKSGLTVISGIAAIFFVSAVFAVMLLTLISDVKILIAFAIYFLVSFALPGIIKNPKGIRIAEIICSVLLFVSVAVISELDKDKSEYTQTYSHGGREYAVYEDDLPLRLEDLTHGVNPEKYLYKLEIDKALLACRYEANQSVRLDVSADEALPELEYTVIKVSGSLLYDICVKNIVDNVEGYIWYEVTTKEMSDNFDDAAAWGANTVYCFSNNDNDTKNRYIICYDGFIVNLETGWKYTPEQVITAGEKLINAVN